MTTARLIKGAAKRDRRRPRSQIIHRVFRKTVTFSQVQRGRVTTVTVTTNLPGRIFYHWYLDGTWVGMTATNQRAFVMLPGEQATIDCIPTQDAGFDYLANSPDVFTRRVVLWWIRSADTDVVSYLVEQQKDAGSWVEIGSLDYEADRWEYRITTPQLDDQGAYAWRVSSVDAAGNVGTPVTLDSRIIVRTPDAPDFTATFNEGTTRVAFAEAA